MTEWIMAHRAEIDHGVRALMLATFLFAMWSLQRDLRGFFNPKDKNHDT